MISSSGVPNRTAWFKQGRFYLKHDTIDAVEEELLETPEEEPEDAGQDA